VINLDAQLVVFELDNQHYGIDIEQVEGIIKMQPITGIPHAPVCLEGVINLRGTVVPIINLRKRFNLPTSEIVDDSRIVVVYMGLEKVGLIVDGVSQVVWMAEEDMEASIDFIAEDIERSYVSRIGKLPDQLVILLNLDRVLHIEENLYLQQKLVIS
jgi:purine-binding chemotaxis protein CheW